MSEADQIYSEPLSRLILYCREADNLFRNRLPYDSSSCFEIWRRALQVHDNEAWTAVMELYSDYVRRWLYERLGEYHSQEIEEDFLINGVFIRVFKNISPDKFRSFPNLSRLMGYVKACCLGEAMDDQRHLEKHRKNVPLQGNSTVEAHDEDRQDWLKTGPETDVEELASLSADRNRLWRAVDRSLPSLADKIVIRARFVEDMPPREIAAAYPHFFSSVNEVNRRFRNAMWRLKQNPDLAQWFKDFRED